jgi:hypothetical protein
MTAANTAERGARRAANSKWLKVLTQVGFVAYGALHLLLAYLAVQIAFGGGGREGDQSGAFQAISAHSYGRFVLVIMAIGLAALAIWQGLLAAVGHVDSRGKARVFERVASAFRAVIYAGFAVAAAKAVAGAPSSSAQKQQNATSGVMAHTAGVWLIGLVGVIVFGVAIGMVVYGLKHKFESKLRTSAMRHKTRQTVRRLGQAGYAGKGAAYAIVGVLLVDAAATNDPSESRGLDSALRALAAKPFGDVLLCLVALGFAAYGVYCFFQSRYRKVGT